MIAAALTYGVHTDNHCHCGTARDPYQGDHCPACGCEEFEGHCDHVAVVTIALRTAPDDLSPNGRWYAWFTYADGIERPERSGELFEVLAWLRDWKSDQGFTTAI